MPRAELRARELLLQEQQELAAYVVEVITTVSAAAVLAVREASAAQPAISALEVLAAAAVAAAAAVPLERNSLATILYMLMEAKADKMLMAVGHLVLKKEVERE